jgi:two-component system OmpR family response regulator
MDGEGAQRPAKILVVEDVKEVQAMLIACLDSAGYSAIGAGDAAGMRKALSAESFDLILLDVRLPDADGVALLRSLRERSDIGIIIVSSRGAPHERANGLESGADDYLPKPVYPRELVARVRNVLERRRGQREQEASPARQRFGRWTLDVENRLLALDDGGSADLTRAEFDLLCLLAQRPGRIMSREALANLMGTAENAENMRKIDVLISRIRRKLASGVDGKVIETCRGYGYRFRGSHD